MKWLRTGRSYMINDNDGDVNVNVNVNVVASH